MKQFTINMHLIDDKYIKYGRGLIEEEKKIRLRAIEELTSGLQWGMLRAAERIKGNEECLRLLEAMDEGGHVVPDEKCNVVDENGYNMLVDWSQMYKDKEDDELSVLVELLGVAGNDEERQLVENAIKELRTKPVRNKGVWLKKKYEGKMTNKFLFERRDK